MILILPFFLQEVLQIGHLPHVLADLKTILMTPIKARTVHENKAVASATELQEKITEVSEEVDVPKIEDDVEESKKIVESDEDSEDENEEDLPAEITRVMGKACTQILVTQPDEECCLTYLGLLDRVLSHEAFSQSDKRRLQSWKAQCQKLARQLATNRKLTGIEKGPRK